MEVGINIMHEGHSGPGRVGWEWFALGSGKALKREIHA